MDANTAGQVAAIIKAAWIQGSLTFTAGFLALIGGSFAYFGAKLQFRAQKERENAERLGYAARLRPLLSDFLSDLQGRAEHANYLCSRAHNGAHFGLTLDGQIEFPEVLRDEHWRDHAKLGHAFVEWITKLNLEAAYYEGFCQEHGHGRSDAVVDGIGKTSVEENFTILSKMISAVGECTKEIDKQR
jgi:hypothetical protein